MFIATDAAAARNFGTLVTVRGGRDGPSEKAGRRALAVPLRLLPILSDTSLQPRRALPLLQRQGVLGGRVARWAHSFASGSGGSATRVAAEYLCLCVSSVVRATTDLKKLFEPLPLFHLPSVSSSKLISTASLAYSRRIVLCPASSRFLLPPSALSSQPPYSACCRSAHAPCRQSLASQSSWYRCL